MITGTGAVNSADHRIRILKSRTVNDGTTAYTWNYQLPPGPNDSAYHDGDNQDFQYVAVVTDPLKNDVVHTFTDVDTIDNSRTYYETETQYYNGASPNTVSATAPPTPPPALGTLLKTVTTDYSYTSWAQQDTVHGCDCRRHAINIFPHKVTTVYPDASGVERTLEYEAGYLLATEDGNSPGATGILGNVKTETLIDHKTGSTLSVTNNTYWPVNGTTWLPHLLKESTVTDGNPGTPNIVSDTNYAYDAAGNLLSTTKTVDSSTTTVVDSSVSTVVTSTNYTAYGMPQTVTDPVGNAASASYTEATITYDSTNLFPENVQKVTTTNGVAHVEHFVYDSNSGKLLSHKDENNYETTYDYHDPLGRLKQIVSPSTTIGLGGSSGQGTVTLVYDDIARTVTSKTAVAASSGQTMDASQAFDGLGRVVGTTAANGATTETTYDEVGRVKSVTNPHFTSSSPTDGTTTFGYDALNRKTLQTQQDMTSQQWIYTNGGNSYIFRNETGNSWVNTVDAFGRLTDVTEPSGFHTSYTYDTLGNLTNVNQPGASGDSPRVRQFAYDWLSRLKSSSNPENGTTLYTYDANGNVLSTTDARGQVVSYHYDALNRPIWQGAFMFNAPYSMKQWAYDAQIVGWGYTGSNLVGHLTFMQNIGAASDGTQQVKFFSYDPVGRVSGIYDILPSQLDGITTTEGELKIGYDLAGNPTNVVYPDGLQVNQGFNSAGQLSSVTNANGAAYVSSVDYSAPGLPKSITYGNGTVETRGANSRLQPCAGSLTKGTSTLLDRTYWYTAAPSGSGCGAEASNNGNIRHVYDNLPGALYNENFGYDALNRLTNWTAPSLGGVVQNQTYAYDAFGNIAQANTGANAVAMSYSNSNKNQVTAATCGGATCTPTYDPVGNITTFGSALQGQGYAWDQLGNLSQFSAEGNSNTLHPYASYFYDDGHHRIRAEQFNGGSTMSGFREYHYLGGDVLSEVDQAGVRTDHIYANGSRIALLKQRPTSGTNTVTVRFADDSCSSCGGGPGGDRNLALASITVDGTTYLGDSSAITGAQVIDSTNHVAWLNSNGDLNLSVSTPVNTLSVNSFSTPDGRYAQMQVLVNGELMENQLTTGTQMAYAIDPGLHYYVGDQVGTAQLELSSAGNVIWQGQFGPFGQQLDSAATSNRYEFTGQERDAESGDQTTQLNGLDYFQARYYANSMGRFLSPDPSGLAYADPSNPQSLNLYTYVLNNPLRFTDPTGLTLCRFRSQSDIPGTHKPGNELDATSVSETGTEQACRDSGGEVIYDNTTVNVHSNGNSTTIEDMVVEAFPTTGGATSKGQRTCGTIAHNVATTQNDIKVNGKRQALINFASRVWPRRSYNPFASFANIGLADQSGWDYKKGPSDKAGANFGNVNYGANCGQFFGKYGCGSAAGRATAIPAPHKLGGPGIPFVKYPYGDQSIDAPNVMGGVDIANGAACKGW